MMISLIECYIASDVEKSNLFDSVDYQNAGPTMNFHARACSIFCDVRVCHRYMAFVLKAMHTTSQHILLESLLSDVKICLKGLRL